MSLLFLNLLRSQFADRAAQPALLYRGESISYGQLDAYVRQCAAMLQGSGLQPGDRVALYTPEKLPFLVAHLATLSAGGISLPLNPRSTLEEMRYFLADSGARYIIAGKDKCKLIDGLCPAISDEEVLKCKPAPFREYQPVADDPCLLIYSSGTTGWPKGVVHTQATLASGLLALMQCWRLTPEDRVVNVLPLFHIHGLSFATFLSLITGACVLLEDQFQPESTMKAIARGTVFMAVPAIYQRLLEDRDLVHASRAWGSVRLFTAGSAPLPPEMLPRLEAILGRPVINRYGMTEAQVITSLPLDGPWPLGSVGLPLDGVELSVLDENGQPSTAGNVGTVLIRGPNLFREYWGNREATSRAFTEGWFDTGDLGFRDRNGFLTLVGRKHDLIITNGYNVYPQVVERVLSACPGVADVAVVGIPDQRRGEQVVAAVGGVL
jgi:malonyl-CoA/methylmalonyl-CoA synthetase